MRIYMIGAGAMGGVYGGLLKRAGYDVTLIDPRAEQVDAIRKQGLTIEGVRGTHVVQLLAQTGIDGLPPADLCIIFTDANSTRDGARSAAKVLQTQGCALTLQNGIGNVEAMIAELGKERVIAGVSMNSAANPAPGQVVYTNSGMTSLGELDGRNTRRVQQAAEMLNKAEIPTEIVSDPMSFIWSKFVHNCCVNALAAITGLRSGEIYRTAEVSELQDHVIDEVLTVVARKGIKLQEEDPRKKIKEHCKVRYNKPSMMQHVEQGRRTEIDALNGALLREARALGMATPYNDAVVAIVKGLEKSRRQLLHEPPRDYARLEAEAQQGK